MIDKITSLLTGVGGLLRTRALLAFGWSGIVGYLFVTGGEVPETLLIINTGVLAYYFGTRGAQTAQLAQPPLI